MSKKPPKADAKRELILARVAYEQQWTYDRRIVDALSWPAIRSLALRSIEDGGLGRNYGTSTLRGLVAAHRAEQGEIVGTREERIERRQHELDALALVARAELARAAAGDEERGIPPYLNEKAAKILLDTRAAEAKMHGDDAALRIEADVTTHDAVDAELDAMLGRIPGRAKAKS